MIVKGEFKRKKLYRGMGEVILPKSPYADQIASQQQSVNYWQNAYNQNIYWINLPVGTPLPRTWTGSEDPFDYWGDNSYRNTQGAPYYSDIMKIPQNLNEVRNSLMSLMQKEQQWISEQTQMILKSQLEETVALQETQATIEYLNAQLMANKNLNNNLTDQINEKTITIGVMEKTISDLQSESSIHDKYLSSDEKEIIALEKEITQTEDEINSLKGHLAESVSNVKLDSSSSKLLLGIGVLLVGGYTLLKE